MSLLRALLGFLDGLMSFINRRDIKQDGRNEEKLENLAVVEERWRKANEIENEPIADDDVSFLLRPEDRTEANLGLLQTGYPAIFNTGANAGDKVGKGASNSDKKSGSSGEYRPRESGVEMDTREAANPEGTGKGLKKTQQEVRHAMPVGKFSKQSKAKLATCHPDLQRLMNEVIKLTDFTVLCGVRGEKEQNEAYAKGVSKLKYPDSKHNKLPSLAVDIAPYPIDWQNILAFKELGAIVKSVAQGMNIPIRWGGDFKGNFKDYPHYELVNV